MPGAGVHQDRLGRAVVHEHAGVLGDEPVVHRLAGREVLVAGAGVDLGGVEVERVRQVDLHRGVRAVGECEVDRVALGYDHRARDAGALVALAVDGEAPDLGRREGLGDLGDVLVDVDLELLHLARRNRRQGRVDPLERLEGDALGVSERRRRLLGGGGLLRGRGGHRGRHGRRRGILAGRHRPDRDGDREHGDEGREPDGHHQPLAPALLALAGRLDRDLHRGSVGQPLRGVVIDLRCRLRLGAWDEC